MKILPNINLFTENNLQKSLSETLKTASEIVIIAVGIYPLSVTFSGVFIVDFQQIHTLLLLLTFGYGNHYDNDGNSHDEDVDSTDFTTKNPNFSKWWRTSKQ